MVSFNTLEALEAHLATRSYVTGYSFSKDDVAVFESLAACPDAAAFPHAARWAKHIHFLSGAHFKGAVGTPAASAAAAPAAAAKDDVEDMFAYEDDDEEESEEQREANKARKARMELARKLKEEKDAKDGKKKDKPKMVEKSLVVLEVKPWEADTDLKMVWEQIIQYKQDGLTWGETFKLEPVAYGIMKLVLTCVIEDAKVLMDDVTENIEALDEYVQSVNVVSMNKI